ncbi:MAG: hypothetical protein HKN43_08230, partial [Rhodothermales bacterium]|nr:hypothetical protein [Rhodothermales bacterium]
MIKDSCIRIVFLVSLTGLLGCNSTDRKTLDDQPDSDNGQIVRTNLVTNSGVPESLSRSDDSLYVPPYDFSGAPSEVEPNDEPENATVLEASTDYAANGSIAARTSDVFKFVAEGDPQLWYIEVVGASVRAAHLTNGRVRISSAGRTSGKAETLTFPNIFLSNGTYYIALEGAGTESAYTVRAVPLGPPDPNFEQEPNDDLSRAHRLSFGVTRRGYLPYDRDVDAYKFTLHGETYEQLSILGAVGVDGKIELIETTRNRRFLNGSIPDSLVHRILLPAGHFSLKYRNTQKSSRQPYSIRLDNLDPHRLPTDLEPNDQSDMRMMPEDHIIEGFGGGVGGDDWYSLPRLESESRIEVTGYTPVPGRDSRSAIAFHRLGESRATSTVAWQRSDSIHSGTLEAGDWQMRVRAEGDYRLNVNLEAVPASELPTESLLSVSMDPPTASVAAYWSEGQQLMLPVRVTNNASRAQDVTIDISTGNRNWIASPSDTSVTVPGGGTRVINAHVRVGADAWDDQDVLIAAAVSSPMSRPYSATVSINAECGVEPINPFLAWNLPEPLLGGFNVAGQMLGGSTTVDRRTAILFDGLATAAHRFREGAPVIIETDLAGTVPIEVKGITLHPQAGGGSIVQPRPFEMQLSDDGTTFTTVLQSTLLPDRYEQSYVLDRTVSATSARLHFPELPGAAQQYI